MRPLIIPKDELEFFDRFRNELFHARAVFKNPWGKEVGVIYADSTAMGPPMESVEENILNLVLENDPSRIRDEYHAVVSRLARQLNAGEQYSLIGVGSGCTAAMNVLTRDILGCRVPDVLDKAKVKSLIPDGELPIFMTSLMEHHSADLVLRECLYKRLVHIGFDSHGLPDMGALEEQLRRASSEGAGPVLIICTAGSNVTGIQPDPRQIVGLAHRYGALVALDYAAAGPYTDLDLQEIQADAIGLSPHKFPGGPQSCGLLCVRRDLLEKNGYRSPIPGLSSMIEMIRVGEVFRVKKEMGVQRIRNLVRFYAKHALQRLASMPNIEVIGDTELSRFAILSFLVRSKYGSPAAPPSPELKPYLLPFTLPDGSIIYYVHHNLLAKLLNDVYGVQVRPGCSCAGPYGHWLLSIDEEQSRYHRDRIDQGLLDQKPGWIRATFNEMNSLAEVETILDAIEELSKLWEEHVAGYRQNVLTGEFIHQNLPFKEVGVDDWTRLTDPNAGGANPAIEQFIQREILPFAANTHTEVSHTGTISTHWYHWAQQTIRQCLGAEDGYGLKFIRAGYDPLRVLLYSLGLELPARLESTYGISRIVPEQKRKRLITLGNPLLKIDTPLLARVVPCYFSEDLVNTAGKEPESTIVLIGFDPLYPLDDFRPLTEALSRKGVIVIADITRCLKSAPISLAGDNLSGAMIMTEKLPGGWQAHPVFLLREDLFANELPMDIGGGIVDWTTKDLQRYVSDRTLLEDAGTPGIIQGIRTGLTIGHLLDCQGRASNDSSIPCVAT